MSRNISSKIWLWFRIFFTSAIIIFISKSLSFESLLSELSGADPFVYLLSSFIFTLLIFLSAYQVLIVLKALNMKCSYAEILKINYLSYFFSLFSMLAGSVVRFFGIAGTDKRRGESLFLMLFERTQQMTSLSILLVISISLNHFGQDLKFKDWKYSIFLAVLVLMIAGFSTVFILLPKSFFSKKTNLLKNQSGKFNFLIEKIEDLFRVKNIMAQSPGTVVYSLFLWIAYSLLGCLFFKYVLESFGVHLGMHPLIYVYSLVTLIQLIPVTVYGAGLREGALVLLLKTYGVSPEQSFLIGIAMFIPCVVHALIGGVWFVLSPSARSHV